MLLAFRYKSAVTFLLCYCLVVFCHSAVLHLLQQSLQYSVMHTNHHTVNIVCVTGHSSLVSLLCVESVHLTMQFYEIDLPHASAIKQRLVQKVLPDVVKVCQSCA